MTLLDQVKEICHRLAPHGWRDLLLLHGLDITANDLKSELLKELDSINRTIEGFQDFSIEGGKGITPGVPAQSLLYHALASPNVQTDANGNILKVFPTLKEIEIVENFVFGIEPPTIRDIISRIHNICNDFNEGLTAIAVFATEYRQGVDTVHKKHADLCFSRTGVCRVGNRRQLYDAKNRGFVVLDENDQYGIRVLPAKYSAYIAVQLKPNMLKNDFKNSFGPLRYDKRNNNDDNLHFWVPLHKLFDGDECIKNENITITYHATHINEKLKRIHLELEKIDGYPRIEKDILNSSPYRFSDGIAEFSSDSEYPPNLLIPIPHSNLVEPAKQNETFITFKVPPNKDNSWSPSLLIKSESERYRHAPEYVHVRHYLENQERKDLNKEKDVINRVQNGKYDAIHYIDFTGDGWIDASCPEIYSDLPRPTIPAYSLVTSPDFFPLVDQGQIMGWYANSVPSALRDTNWYDPNPREYNNLLQALSDERFSPNIEHNTNPNYPFRKEDLTITAIVTIPISNRLTNSIQDGKQDLMTYTCLPDGASGVYAPGWDISLDNSGGVAHYAAYGLGSPFPEDMKLCAALSSFWPAVSPDSARSFWWDGRPNGTFPTISPLLDTELSSQNEGIPWDGTEGPVTIDEHTIQYIKSEYVDYVDSALNNKFTLHKTSNVNVKEYKDRILSIAKAFHALSIIRATPADQLKSIWLLTSFAKIPEKHNDVTSAQAELKTVLREPIYRIELIRGSPEDLQDDDHSNFKKKRVKVTERYLFLTTNDSKVCLKHDVMRWEQLSTE